LRSRLAISGDLDRNASAAENEIYDSYVEEAVRRFQARHGLTINGIVHEATFAALNVAAATRRDQLKVNIERLKTQSRPALCRLQYSGRTDRSNRTRCRRVALHRRRRQAGSAVAGDRQQNRRNQFQSLLDGPSFDRAQGSYSADAGPARLFDVKPHSHSRRRAS
jgi:peptidoglycan hydrolase-like protein with peptidoglycan-binding domain